MGRRSAVAATTILSLSTLVTGCSGDGERESGSSRPAAPETSSPVAAVDLAVDDPTGGASIAAPRGVSPWWGSFGARFVCSDEPVVIDAVTARWRVQPVAAEFLLRSTDGPGTNEAGVTSTTFISALGRAPRLDEPYADELGLSGRFRPTVGATVDLPCSDVAPEGPFVELVMTVRSDEGGSDLRDIRIDYHSVPSGEPRQLLLDTYRMVTCGSEVEESC